MSQPAAVRIYLFTYRRHDTLGRALDGLLNQTHTDWVCELHNDDPDDAFPEHLVARINDPRITYVRHDDNLGPVRSFNLVCRPVEEPFVSILEDDNWWEAEFLATALDAMRQHPSVSLAWSNMWFWRETDDRRWEKQGTIWPMTESSENTLFDKPDPRGVCYALHSHGAMLLRNTPRTMVPVPDSLPVFAIEPVRERALPGPFLLLRRPMANFALTNGSARVESADENMQVLVLLAQTFLQHARVPDAFYRSLWIACRGSLGHKQRALIVGSVMAGRLRHILKAARPGDLVLVIAWMLRHPIRVQTLFRAHQRYPEVSAFLDRVSRA